MALVLEDTKSILECKGLQQEECDVLESIYPGICSPSSPSVDGTLRLEIPVEFTEPRSVLLVEDDALAVSSPEQDAQNTLSLSSLPPLIISIILPPTYPISSPPILTSIRATHIWLPLNLRLQSILTEMWQPGEGVLYTWIEFIRTGDFLHSLFLISHTDNSTVRISHPSPHVLGPLLKSYDVSVKSTQFSQSTYLCSICLTSMKGTKCIQLFCSHIFCRSCLEDFWKLCIAEGDVGRVSCPDPQCVKAGLEASIEDIIRVVTPSEVQRYRWLREKRALEKDPSIIPCPMAFCQNLVPKPNDQDHGSGWDRLRSCSVCSFSFCAFCRRTWHGPITSCPIAHSEKLVLEYLAHPENSPERQFIERRFGKTNVLKLVATYEEERANKEWLHSSTMACPGCQVHVEKSLGCNHMTCIKCRQHFCYRCGTKLPPGDPYTHFSTVGQRCYNKLFDFQAADEEWQPVEGFDVI